MKTFLIALTVALLITLTVVIYRRNHRGTLKPAEPTASLVFRKKTLAIPRSRSLLRPGTTISGPLKNRRLAHVVYPEYPEWAERDGTTAKLSAMICVHPDGNVSSFIQVTRMSTELRLDELAIDALRQWRFSKVAASHGDQWGIVTFQFKLLYSRPFGALTVKVTGPILEVS